MYLVVTYLSSYKEKKVGCMSTGIEDFRSSSIWLKPSCENPSSNFLCFLRIYLDSQVPTPVCLCDVRTSDVVQDDQFNANVANFGVSRAVEPEAIHDFTNIQ
uniref:Uncharacterized protein n=1 Tax=Physcomitrium patens TaxID=3218 RepID=A0A2K1J6P5_PHYPA|nr:hypothetical protein PHYPA_020307 [Physcomitrium patens]